MKNKNKKYEAQFPTNPILMVKLKKKDKKK